MSRFCLPTSFLSPRDNYYYWGPRWLVTVAIIFVVLLHHKQLEAFPTPVPSINIISPSHRTDTQIFVVKSRPPRNKRSKGRAPDDDSSSASSWNKFKKIVYGGVDGISAIFENDDDPKKLANNAQKGNIAEGYDGTGISGTYKSPVERLLGQESSSPRIRQGPPISTIQQQRQAELETSKKSAFDNFKSGIYSAADLVTGPAPSKKTNDRIKDKFIETKGKSTTNGDDIDNSIPTTLVVPSKPSLNQIREQEARARAAVRNEKIRAKKEDLYRIVDSLQAFVDALPETFDKTEEGAKEAFEALKTTVQRIQRIPSQLEQTAKSTSQTLQRGAEQTQRVVKNIQNMPNTVNQSVQSTQKAIANTQEAVQDTATKVKVMSGLEKPKPRPPKTPPPPQKKPKNLALDLAGKAVEATGKFALWTGKEAATLAWKGAKVAYEKGKEAMVPAIEEAWEKQVNQKNAAPQLNNDRRNDDFQGGEEVNRNSSKTMKNSASNPKEFERQLNEAKALAKEVEEALDTAEKALLISDMEESDGKSSRRKK